MFYTSDGISVALGLMGLVSDDFDLRNERERQKVFVLFP